MKYLFICLLLCFFDAAEGGQNTPFKEAGEDQRNNYLQWIATSVKVWLGAIVRARHISFEDNIREGPHSIYELKLYADDNLPIEAVFQMTDVFEDREELKRRYDVINSIYSFDTPYYRIRYRLFNNEIYWAFISQGGTTFTNVQHLATFAPSRRMMFFINTFKLLEKLAIKGYSIQNIEPKMFLLVDGRPEWPALVSLGSLSKSTDYMPGYLSFALTSLRNLNTWVFQIHRGKGVPMSEKFFLESLMTHIHTPLNPKETKSIKQIIDFFMSLINKHKDFFCLSDTVLDADYPPTGFNWLEMQDLRNINQIVEKKLIAKMQDMVLAATSETEKKESNTERISPVSLELTEKPKQEPSKTKNRKKKRSKADKNAGHPIDDQSRIPENKEIKEVVTEKDNAQSFISEKEESKERLVKNNEEKKLMEEVKDVPKPLGENKKVKEAVAEQNSRENPGMENKLLKKGVMGKEELKASVTEKKKIINAMLESFGEQMPIDPQNSVSQLPDIKPSIVPLSPLSPATNRQAAIQIVQNTLSQLNFSLDNVLDLSSTLRPPYREIPKAPPSASQNKIKPKRKK